MTRSTFTKNKIPKEFLSTPLVYLPCKNKQCGNCFWIPQDVAQAKYFKETTIWDCDHCHAENDLSLMPNHEFKNVINSPRTISVTQPPSKEKSKVIQFAAQIRRYRMMNWDSQRIARILRLSPKEVRQFCSEQGI